MDWQWRSGNELDGSHLLIILHIVESTTDDIWMIGRTFEITWTISEWNDDEELKRERGIEWGWDGDICQPCCFDPHSTHWDEAWSGRSCWYGLCKRSCWRLFDNNVRIQQKKEKKTADIQWEMFTISLLMGIFSIIWSEGCRQLKFILFNNLNKK